MNSKQGQEMLVPVVLSGGSGSRLWPVSREGLPKPFMKLADGQSLLQKAYHRASLVAQGGEVLTVTNRDYFFMSKDEFARAQFGIELRASYLLEPFGRNTAPAVGLAAMYVQEKFGSDACLLVLAADHLVQDQQGFIKAVDDAKSLAQSGKLVTFGIVPTAPEVGFGYIEVGEDIGPGKLVSRFVEKPSLVTAESYLASGKFLWNAGMFCFKVAQLLEEMALHAPALFEQVTCCWESMRSNQKPLEQMLEIPAAGFEAIDDIPIDYALMERSENIAVIPADIGWSDIGSWNAVSQLVNADTDNNRAVGDAVFIDSKNVFVQSENRLVAALGIADLMIIDTADALLVAHPDKAQNVKQIVATLKKRGHEAYKLHRTVIRPWGTYTVIEEGTQFKIKRIEVRPGASLSLQMHHHRSEHWIVVSGMAKVVNGEQEFFVRTNESTYIPAGYKHRLENPGVLDLVMIEVQSGEYLGEDDIVRFEDQYGRI